LAKILLLLATLQLLSAIRFRVAQIVPV